MSKVNMAVNLGGIPMKNPVNTAAGTFGAGWQFEHFMDVGQLGAFTTKGAASVAWPGNPQPRMTEVRCGVMNSRGPDEPRRARTCGGSRATTWPRCPSAPR